MMNRGIEKGDDHMNVANCLMLLSKVGESNKSDDGLTKLSPTGRLFACKTCNRKFSSFQALGGHRASHKKPKLDAKDWFKLPSSPAKPKTHECPICGLEFPIGQALGGHMRRHRGADTNTKSERLVTRALLPAVSIMKKSSSKRIFCLDLNLTPMENDLTLQLGKLASACI